MSVFLEEMILFLVVRIVKNSLLIFQCWRICIHIFLTNSTEEYIVPVDLNNPKFEPLLKMPEKIGHIYETSFLSTLSFLDVDENSLLLPEGGKIDVN